MTFKEFLLAEKTKASYVDFKGSSKKRELKKEMEREISRFKKMPHDDPKAYPDDWTADKKYKAELKKKGKELPKSRWTEKFKQMYGEALVESNIDTALQKKAEKTGFKKSILRAVYNRGLAAWRTGHRPGVSQHQWAMGRVNSFLVGGPARKVDKDLWDKRK